MKHNYTVYFAFIAVGITIGALITSLQYRNRLNDLEQAETKIKEKTEQTKKYLTLQDLVVETDTTASYWFVTFKTNSGSDANTVVRQKHKYFSIREFENNIIENSNMSMILITTFKEIPIKTYLDFNASQLKKED